MINIHNSQELKDLDAHLVMTIHDEVMMECPALYAEEVSELLPKVMIETAAPYISVSMKCDPAVESRADLSIAAADCRRYKPTSDIVEVVRCKDCKLHEEMEGLIGGTCLYCSHWNKNVDPNEFCSHGW